MDKGFSFALFIVSLVLFLGDFVLFYYLIKLKNKFSKQEQSVSRLSAHILSSAQEKAEKIIKASLEKARKTITDVENIKKTQTEVAAQALGSLEDSTVKELEDFRKELHKQTLIAEDGMQEKIKLEFTKTQEDIEDYKDKKLKDIEAAASKIVLEVAKDVLGKALDPQAHQRLIEDALEKAKREGLFLDESS